MRVTSDIEMQDSISLNRLDELIVPENPDRVVMMDAITQSTLVKTQAARDATRRSGATDSDREDQASARGGRLDRQ